MSATLEFPETQPGLIEQSEAAVWMDGGAEPAPRPCRTSTTYLVFELRGPELLADYAEAAEALKEAQEEGVISWEDLKAELGI